ncbi:MAG: HK97-gp10 family putative phage morphogenesis protein [Candidatus Saccharimonadales bacterium]
MAKGSTFRIDLSILNRLGRKFGQIPKDYDDAMRKRVAAATQIVWATAHAKRPMMNRAQAKAHGSKVSLPDPSYKRRGYTDSKDVTFSMAGVPVKTGRLQGSIKQSVTRTKNGWQGRVETSGVPYAKFMEFGTSKVAARPFMRPAVFLNKAAIKKQFDATVTHNF